MKCLPILDFNGITRNNTKNNNTPELESHQEKVC